MTSPALGLCARTRVESEGGVNCSVMWSGGGPGSRCQTKRLKLLLLVAEEDKEQKDGSGSGSSSHLRPLTKWPLPQRVLGHISLCCSLKYL